MANETRDKLFTRNYILVCLSAFLMSFSFFILVPTLPLYLKDTFGISQTLVGVVLSCYVIAVLSVRPIAGFVADTLPRKSVYVAAYAIFVPAKIDGIISIGAPFVNFLLYA